MLAQPSTASAKSTASKVESSTVQPMLCVQVRNMGTRLFWIWFWSSPESVCVMALGLRCDGSDMSKCMQSAKAQITEFKTVIGMNTGRGRGNGWTLWLRGHSASFAEQDCENKLFQNGTQNGFLRTQTVTCLPFIDSLFKSLSAIYQ
jgi:hypothetical protein